MRPHRRPSDLAYDKLDLGAAAERSGLTRDASLLGYIDNVDERPPGGQFIQGWGGDSGPSARPVDVLMFQCGVFLGAAPAEGIRPEVATALRVSRQNFGFSAVFSKQRCAQDGLAGLITAGDRRFSLIYPTTP
jgi:hypothetical protein